jgi:hypothetical protein
MNIKYLIKLLFILFVTQNHIQAICSEIIVGKKQDKEIIFINDRHIDQKINKKSNVQKEQILNHCCLMDQKAKNQDEKVILITEDNHYYDGSNQNVKKFIDKASAYLEEKNKYETRATYMHTLEDEEIVPGSILANFTNDSMHLNLDCYNAECTQTTLASQWEDTVSGADVVIDYENNKKHILNELEQIKNQIDCNPEAQIIYDECMRIMQTGQNNANDLVEQLRGCSQSMRQLEADGHIENENNFLDLFDRYFVDVRILLGWYKNRERKIAIVVAGFCHIERILPVFEQLGYRFEIHGKKYDDRAEMVKNCIDINEFFVAYNDSRFNSYSLLKTVSRELVQPYGSTLGAAFTLMADGISELLA